MEWYLLIKPLGIVTYSLVLLNVLGGLFNKSIKWKFRVKLHTIIGILTLIIATCHFVLVLINS